jgi:hypothetical protein
MTGLILEIFLIYSTELGGVINGRNGHSECSAHAYW